MEKNKNIRNCCFVVLLISLFIAVVISISQSSIKIENFLYDISMEIFTGTFLSGLTAAIVYNYQKREKICALKLDINKEIEEYLVLFYSIEYVYFKDKLSNELKALDKYEKYKIWYESFVSSNENLLKNNIERLKNIRKINYKKLQFNIDELLKINKKISIPEYNYFKSQIEIINNRSRYFDFNPIEASIPNVYKNIQNIIFECRNENGEKTLNDIQLKNNDIYPTSKINLIINCLESISSKIQQ